MLKVGITKFPDTLILSKHFLNKTSFAQNHNLCLHNDFKLSNKRLKSIFQAVEENDINLSFSNISLKGRINNALNKIAHYFLPCYFNSESNQYIAVRLIYTHIKQSHPHKRAHQTTKTIMNIAQMCKDPDKFIHSVSFTPSKTLDSQKLYSLQINDVCFGSDIFLITDEIEKEHFFNCDPDSGILKFKSQNISSLTSCCESFLEKIVQHDIFLKQTELQQKSLEEKSDDEFFDALEYEDQEKLESKIEKIDLPFFMEKRDLSKLILDFPEKIKNISFYRMPFGPIQKQIEIQSWHRIEIEKKMMQHFRMSLQNLKSFIPEKNLGPTEYIESTDCFRIHFKMQKFAYNCTCYFDVKLIFNCYFDCFDIVLNNVDSKNIKFITNSLLPTINSLMIVISKEEVYKVIYEIIFALDLCFKKLPLILEQEHKTLLRT